MTSTASPPLRRAGAPTRWLERRLAELLFPPGTGSEDFLQPAGEPALVGPESVSWQVFRNPLSVFVGGVAAVILELAEPRVRSGVWEHTRFRDAPLARLQRTGYAAMMTVYGPRSRSERLIAGVNARHHGVTGHAPDGRPYRASDPVLLAWVHVTASYGFVQAYRAWVRPLTPAAVDAFYAEAQAAARLYGVATPPACQAQAEALLQDMRPQLEASAIVQEFLAIVRRMPALPWPLRPLQAVLVKAAVQCLPEWTRERLGLTGARWQLPGWQAALLRRAGRAADRQALATHPAVQACQRLGLPANALYAGTRGEHRTRSPGQAT